MNNEENAWVAEEIYVIGYCWLKKRVSLEEIADKIKININKVESIINSCILKDKFVASLGVSKKGHLHVKTFEKPQISIDYQILYSTFPEKHWKAIPGLGTINFDRMQIDLSFYPSARTLAGLLALRREVKLSSILEQIIIPKNDSSLSEKHILIRLLSMLALSNFIEIMLYEGIIYSSNYQSISFKKEINHLVGFEEFNYSAFLSILSRNSSIKLHELTRIISVSSINWSNNEILSVLSNLIIDGIVTAYLDNDNLLFCSNINDPSLNYALNFNERILLGMLSAKKSAKIKDFAELLEIQVDEAKQYYYSFLNQSNIQGEISRGGDIIIRNLPITPQLIQVVNLSRMEREILGYIIASKKISLSKIAEVWKISKVEFDKIVFNLVGLGLLMVNYSKKLPVYQSHQIPDIPPIFDHNAEPELMELIKILESNGPDATNLLEKQIKSKNKLMKKLLYLVGSGIYPNATLVKNIFDKGGKARILVKIIECTNCGKGIDHLTNQCPECKTEIKKCSICRGFIDYNARISQCPNCNYPAHEDHLIAWLGIKNECPICKNSISISTLSITRGGKI